MVNLGGRIYMRRSSNGKCRYYLRTVKRTFENGIRRRQDQWMPLGPSLELARQQVRALREKQEALARGETPKPDLTLGKGIEWYIQRIKVLLAWKEVKRQLDYFLNHVGDMPMRRISREHVEQFIAERRLKVRPSTANTTLRDVKRFFNAAVDVGYLDKNPAERVKAKRCSTTVCKLPSALEVERLMQAAPAMLRRVVLLLVSTGARLSEILGLDWSDVDFTSNTLKLRRRKVEDELEMPMGQRLKQELWALALEQGWPTKGSIFPGKNSKPVSREPVWRTFKHLARHLGWPWLTLKTFRRLAATEVWRQTGDLRAVQKLLGHSSLRTSEIYMQGDREARELAVGAMDNYLSRTGVINGVTRRPATGRITEHSGREN